MKYLGHLSQKDPLYGYLGYDIPSQLGVNSIAPDFRVSADLAQKHDARIVILYYIGTIPPSLYVEGGFTDVPMVL
ncbi:MAG TPA: hypothetical protein VKF36_04635 [Syntrophorhabdales bacterium]|nr:hypothetical protein [Syntrophorhabdales bacterium]